MEVVVQKYGGTSVADKGKLELVTEKIIKAYNNGNNVVVVVSAQGDTTDNIINRVKEYTNNLYNRDMDLILSTGEIQTVSLLTMMLKDKGYSAVGLTGEQAGIITNGEYGRAKIIKVIKENIEKYINDGNIVIVAGFQGVDKFGNITTLGRGGSDLSAVAIAASLGARQCEIYTDVDGIYSADPKVIKKAVLLKEISYEEILEAATAGAKVLHNRSVGVAKIFDVPLVVKNSQNETEGTNVKSSYKLNKLESYGAKIITMTNDVSKITIIGESLISNSKQLNKIFLIAEENEIQIMMITFSEISINIIVKKENASNFLSLLHDNLIDNNE